MTPGERPARRVVKVTGKKTQVGNVSGGSVGEDKGRAGLADAGTAASTADQEGTSNTSQSVRSFPWQPPAW